MELMYSAEKKSPTAHQFAFAFASLPDDSSPKLDGNDPEGVLDGNAL